MEVSANPDPSPGLGDPASPFTLFVPPAEAEYIRKAYAAARVVLEYGSGGSTLLAAESGCTVFSVESDRAWADRLAAHIGARGLSAHVHYVDIGQTGNWGKPSEASAFRQYHRYALSVWDRPDFQAPDIVLIDGRFRAACLVAVKLRATRPTTVLFDDYTNRRWYHEVEGLAVKEEVVGRMARFTVTPGPIPPALMTQAIGWFTDPR